MRILIILAHNNMTGVTTFAYTLAKELKLKGYEIDIEINDFNMPMWNFQYNYTDFIDLITPYVNNIVMKQQSNYNSYDAILVNYNIHEHLIEQSTPKKIFVTHGHSPIPGEKLPFYFPNNKSIYNTHIAVCQKTKEVYDAEEVIYNGIDLEMFTPNYNSKSNPVNVLHLSRYPLMEKTQVALEELGLDFNVAVNGKSQNEVVQMIEDCDFVIAYGRSAYESMARGKPVFMDGYNGTDGWITEENFEDALKGNCSGWLNDWEHGQTFLSVEKLIDELKKYDYKMGETNRKLAENYLSSTVMSNKYDEIIKNLYQIQS